jgi:hypothetical protein
MDTDRAKDLKPDEAQAALMPLATHKAPLTVRETVELRKLKLAYKRRPKDGSQLPWNYVRWVAFWGCCQYLPPMSRRWQQGLPNRSWWQPFFFVGLSRATCRRDSGA